MSGKYIQADNSIPTPRRGNPPTISTLGVDSAPGVNLSSQL